VSNARSSHLRLKQRLTNRHKSDYKEEKTLETDLSQVNGREPIVERVICGECAEKVAADLQQVKHVSIRNIKVES
jgi:hypothetical protein